MSRRRIRAVVSTRETPTTSVATTAARSLKAILRASWRLALKRTPAMRRQSIKFRSPLAVSPLAAMRRTTVTRNHRRRNHQKGERQGEKRCGLYLPHAPGDRAGWPGELPDLRNVAEPHAGSRGDEFQQRLGDRQRAATVESDVVVSVPCFVFPSGTLAASLRVCGETRLRYRLRLVGHVLRCLPEFVIESESHLEFQVGTVERGHHKR